jgi:hypothetical protein
VEVFQQPSTNHNNIGRLTWCCEDHQKHWASYDEVKDWRFCRGFQNCEESWIRRWLSIEKPQLFCLVRSCHNINCSNIFAKIDIPLPLKFVYQHLPDSRLLASTPLNHMQPLFPKRYKPDEMWRSLGVPRPFQLNSCKNFKNRDRMMVSKKRVEFVKDDVIGHIVTRTSSEWHVIEIAQRNTDIARIVDPRRALNCQSCYGIFAILHFVLGSHLTLQRNMSFCCLFVVMKSWDASFKGYFDKICLIKLQHAKFNHEH